MEEMMMMMMMIYRNHHEILIFTHSYLFIPLSEQNQYTLSQYKANLS